MSNYRRAPTLLTVEVLLVLLVTGAPWWAWLIAVPLLVACWALWLGLQLRRTVWIAPSGEGRTFR